MLDFEIRSHKIVLTNYDSWDLSPWPHQSVTYIGFELAAAFHDRSGVEPFHNRGTMLNC